MLLTLNIKNIALISTLTIDFSKGLNIITGETGAGKSIIIDSINLVLGGRAIKDIIKTGEQKARVEATFDISDCKSILGALDEEGIDIDDDMQITISRELSIKPDSPTVKSICRVNGSMLSLTSLKNITEHIVDVHGQHEHQSLLEQPKHMAFLDEFAGDDILTVKKNVRELYNEYHSLSQKMHVGFISEEERERRLDILSYQIQEIETVSPTENEDEKLEAEQTLLESGEKILGALRSANHLLSNGENGALTNIKAACNELYPISGLSDEYSEMANALSEALYTLEGAVDTVKSAADNFSYDEERLEEISSRLSALAVLKRKYGSSLKSVLSFYEKAKAELDELLNGEEIRKKQQEQLIKLLEKYNKEALLLSEKRKKAAERFSYQVTEELRKLGLKKAEFSVLITRLEGEMPANTGIDFVEFMLTTNPGEPKKQLRKVASGGEISRVMLALKAVLSDCEDIGTMIFDEIDTGISGETATTVGSEMRQISQGKQVIAITHLPQIAAFAESHYFVEKIQTDTNTTSSIRLLSRIEQIKELARIMGGADSQAAIRHAEELLDKVNQ